MPTQADKKEKVGALTLRPFVRAGKETGQWQVDIPAHLMSSGRRGRRLVSDRAAAHTLARDILKELRLKGIIAPSTNRPTGISVEELVLAWVEVQETRIGLRKKRATTLETNMYQLQGFVRQYGQRIASSITTSDLEAYQTQRLEAGARAATINSETATLRQVFRWGHENGHLPKVPHTDPIPADETDPLVLTPSEAERIAEALKEPVRTLFLFLLATGTRWGEAAYLRWKDVDLEEQVALVTPTHERQLKTRGSRRKLFLPGGICDLLRELPADNEYVFVSPKTGKPYHSIRKTLSRAGHRVGIQRDGEPRNVTAQTLRTTYATWQAARHVEEATLQKLIGHRRGSRVTKQFYINAQDDQLRAAAASFPMPKLNDRDG